MSTATTIGCSKPPRLSGRLDEAVIERVESLATELVPRRTALEHNEEVGGIVIRGISDLCDDKDAGGEASQRLAAANAAAFAFELLEGYIPLRLQD